MISGRSALRAAFRAGGAVATVAGLHTAIAGGRSVAGEGPAGAAIESELRFYGTFYAAYGIAPEAGWRPARHTRHSGRCSPSSSCCRRSRSPPRGKSRSERKWLEPRARMPRAARSEQRASRGAGAIT